MWWSKICVGVDMEGGGVETLGMQGRRRDEWEGVGIGKEEGEGRRGEIREGGERRGTKSG